MASPQLFKICAEFYVQDQDDEDSRDQTITPGALPAFDPLTISDAVRNSTTSPVADRPLKKVLL